MAAMFADDFAELDTRIEALAQELKDMFFDCYMNLMSTRSITIDKGYKPPKQLQIDRKTREKAADSYYRHPRVFCANHSHSHFNCFHRWMSVLESSAHGKIEEIRLRKMYAESDVWNYYFLNSIEESFKNLRPGVLKVWSQDTLFWEQLMNKEVARKAYPALAFGTG